MPPTNIYEVRTIRRPHGGAQALLLANGLPVILPTLWADELGLTARLNTVKAYLSDIKIVYEWAGNNHVSISDRIRALEGFSQKELRNIVGALSTKPDGCPASRATCERRLQSFRRFIAYAFEQFGGDLNDEPSERRADKLSHKIQRRVGIYFQANRWREVGPRRITPLSRELIQKIASVLDPDSDCNPFKRQEVRWRNYSIFLLAIETWLRRSEIVLLQLDDVDLSERPTVTVSPDNSPESLKRRDGASIKTRGRTIPISPPVSDVLRVYRDKYRDALFKPTAPSAAFFLSARDGRRMSAGALNQILKLVDKQIGTSVVEGGLHPHKLRTTGATIFRDDFYKAHPEGADDDFRDTLAYLGGWSPQSDMVNHYSKEAISERVSAFLSFTSNVLGSSHD